MWPFRRREIVGREAPPLYVEASFHDRLNQLASRVDALELASAERQVAVLTVAEKVLHQLRAREMLRKRVEEAERAVQDPSGSTNEESEALDPSGSTNEESEAPGYPPAPISTAHLARRFRSAGG